MSTTHQSNVLRRKVLVTGASGLLSVAAMEKFVAAAWEAGRLPSGRDVDFLSVDLRDDEKHTSNSCSRF